MLEILHVSLSKSNTSSKKLTSVEFGIISVFCWDDTNLERKRYLTKEVWSNNNDSNRAILVIVFFLFGFENNQLGM